MKGTGLTLAFLTSVTSVTAHATFQQLWVNDVDQDTKCVRTVVSTEAAKQRKADIRFPMH